MKNTYEIQDLHADQLDALSDRFGEAVISANPDQGTLQVALSESDCGELVHSGFFPKKI